MYLLQAVVEIQRRLPNARVLYVSATGATEAENLCYMTRLGLWGDKTAFEDKLVFVNMLQQRGVGKCSSSISDDADVFSYTTPPRLFCIHSTYETTR